MTEPQDHISKNSRHKEPPRSRREFLKVAAASALGAKAVVDAQAGDGTEFTGQTTQQALPPTAIEIDFSKIAGIIKALNGVNGGPVVTRGAFNLSRYFSELEISHIRLHDIPWMYENVVDINYVFPRFDADADDPKNYNFSLTDYYINSLVSLKTEITYRLGYSAEWKYHPPIHNIPPKDFAKWAAICAHIVQHYNLGWANGYRHNIRYWEIWNEPDITSFWSGTPEEYYRLYGMTAKAIKALDTTLKVGGPALALHLKFLVGFLKYCRDYSVPLDFVSWHRYGRDPADVISEADVIQSALNRYDLSRVENILDEWNYFPGSWTAQENDANYRRHLFVDQMGSSEGAAYVAAMLMMLQHTTVTLADFYQGTNMFWGGLFDEFGVPRKPYFALKAFAYLLNTPYRATITGLTDNYKLAFLAGISKKTSEAAILIANYGNGCNHYNMILKGLLQPFTSQTYLLDSHHDLELIRTTVLKVGTYRMKENIAKASVCLIRLSPVT